MDKENQDKNLIFGELVEEKQAAQPVIENLAKNIFDDSWRNQWSMDLKDIIFGPKIGAGGFGEVSGAFADLGTVGCRLIQSSDLCTGVQGEI